MSNLSDLTFVGSGISSSFTLLNLLDLIEKNGVVNKLEINCIDKYPEFNCGVPYGERSGTTALLITSIKDFLPEPEYGKFIEWLNLNKKDLIETYRNDGGNLSEKWLEKHSIEIEENEWKNLFLPRFFFGNYIKEKVNLSVESLEKKGAISLNYIASEVLDIERNNDGYKILLSSSEVVKTKKVVLSVGSLPTRNIISDEYENNDDLIIVNNAYDPTLGKVLENIKDYCINKKEPSNVLIIGANASGLELLYKLNDIKEIQENVSNYAFLSTQGLVPSSKIDKEKLKEFSTANINSLKNKEKLKAIDIAQAVFKDLDYADTLNLEAASTVGIISKEFGSLLSKLDQDELINFACLYGNEIGRRQRCAGEHYLETIDNLKSQGSYDHIAGRFDSIKTSKGNGCQVDYIDSKTNEIKTIDKYINIIVNCVGSMTFNDPNVPLLIKNLIDKKYCIPNASKIGFDVNENLETSEGIYIIGPLLAGNVIEEKPIWHVEHCGRIIWLSEIVANKIYKKIV